MYIYLCISLLLCVLCFEYPYPAKFPQSRFQWDLSAVSGDLRLGDDFCHATMRRTYFSF